MPRRSARPPSARPCDSWPDDEIAAPAKADDVARRLMTVPGIGTLMATAIEALGAAGENVPLGPRLRHLSRPDARTALN